MAITKQYESPLGEILLAADGDGLTGLWFRGQHYFGAGLDSECEAGEPPVLKEACRWLDCYFDGQEPGFTPPLFLDSTPFRLMVWDILQQIPYGQTLTYGEIAQMVAQQKGLATMSAQAVGGAVAHNPISLIVPCHRVVGSNGSLTGYAGGIGKKIQLLTLEKVDLSKLFVPKKGTAL